ncbi:uncharacterized protein [Nicotiana tomentosiformis]|uniref:Uncharacterized protein n=2 Tax=Nicotiana tabacum TaxID=4097 RepID=A0A1S3ZXY3_TOBAC|nr:uncharacterized protein LOC104110723 [Nicotiana tomentosiformis]XP_016469208.1 PREDICTED: uncharacterized protein LOC107791628 [Nicotiana tabacum]
MAPNMETNIVGTNQTNKKVTQNPPKLPMDGLQRTISDISFELSKEVVISDDNDNKKLPPISEVEDAKCECCGMSEECTPNYIKRVREKFSGKLICGLCSEAVKEEMEKNGGKRLEEALNEHMNACSKFNRFDRAYPVLFQAEAMREILKKNRAKSLSPRDPMGNGPKKGGISRSSSCIPAITKDIDTRKIVD